MVQYVKEIISDIAHFIETKRINAQKLGLLELLPVLAEELDRLDPRDFLYAYQYQFVIARQRIRIWSRPRALSQDSYPTLLDVCNRLNDCLDNYGGEGSRAETRDFSFISDLGLKEIIERDYKELSLVLLPGGAWKSCVVLAGSILEAILYDILTADPTTLTHAQASSKAPQKRDGTVKDILQEEWRLVDLISVAEDIGKIPKESAKAIDQILRDYRNFVHPKKEIRAQHPCTEAQALMAKGALDAVCDFL
jgi:hypothetical protein